MLLSVEDQVLSKDFKEDYKNNLNNKRVNSNLFLIGKDDTLVGLVDQ
jgi:hypothetical protein